MSILVSRAAPFFATYVYPTIVSAALCGVALAALGIGVMVFRAAVHP